MRQFFSKFLPSQNPSPQPLPISNIPQKDIQDDDPARALLQRVIGTKADYFDIEYIQQDQGKDIFEIESLNSRITLRGNNGVSVASALNYYLKNYCNSDITWNGSNINIPIPLPTVPSKIHITSPYKYRYYLNYCTFCYSMTWWDWERWQWEIDWMAMNGINLPLAITGEEAIWQQVYKAMGFTDQDLQAFFSGPAYFGWLFMGNLDGWGGPLPQHWIDSHKDLQVQILARERSLGMTPVLPAFTGHVPPNFTTKYPDAKVTKVSSWNGFPDVYILDPSDTLFATIGGNFLKAQTQAYGTDHFYSADTFNENVPPSSDPAYIKQISQQVFNSMTAVDPKAIWVMQGWMFYYDSSFWQAPQIQALLGAVPDDQMIVLDLFTEEYPVWKSTEAYYGKPWVWNMLQNFGGRTSLYGRMSTVAKEPSAALNDPSSSKSLVGVGLTPEAIEQNPAVFELMLENVWQSQAINVTDWLKKYASRRYGASNSAIDNAWTILLATVYSGGLTRGGSGSMICARPTFNTDEEFIFTELNYDPLLLVQVWKTFVTEAKSYLTNEGYRYDLIDITRQVLANYSNKVQQLFTKAYQDKDTANFTKYTTEFLAVTDDMDTLLATHQRFLLGKWISDARGWGQTTDEQNLYELNARNLLTLWGDKDCPIYDYACKEWAGLFKGFYKPRWQEFFTYLGKLPADHKPSDLKDFNDDIKTWEWNWVTSTNGGFSPTPQGNTFEVVAVLFAKYYLKVSKAYILKGEDDDWDVIV